jgi:AcrR family transcriptional regulator
MASSPDGPGRRDIRRAGAGGRPAASPGVRVAAGRLPGTGEDVADDDTEARRPQQARGQRRVEAILDAAAALIAEAGVADLTMQAIAQRSRTASGSLYHFFPDRDAVLRALAERHVRGLRGVLAATRAGLAAAQAKADGAPIPAAALVDQMLGPAFAYKEAHPEYRLVEEAMAAPGTIHPYKEQLHQAARAVAEQLVLARDPLATPRVRAMRAATIMAAVGGVMDRLQHIDDARSRSEQIRELKRLLAAYLESMHDAQP